MPQKTQYDPRVYDARFVARFATPGYEVDDQRYYAIPGTNTVVAFDVNRSLSQCRDAGDLGEQPQAVAFAAGDLWTVTVEGALIRLDVAEPDPLDMTNLGHRLVEMSRDRVDGRNPTWLLAGRYPTELRRVDWLGKQLQNDVFADRVEYDIGTDILMNPWGGAGVECRDAATNTVTSRLTGFLPQLVCAAYWPEQGRAYFFDDCGRMAVISVSTYGVMDIVNVIDARRLMGLRTDARVLPKGDGTYRLMVASFDYKRVYFFDLTDPDNPVSQFATDFRTDPNHSPVTTLSYADNPIVFVRGGDVFMDAVDLPVSAARANTDDILDRVYAHGEIGAVSFLPGESVASILGGVGTTYLPYRIAENTPSGFRYGIALTLVTGNPFPAPGDNIAIFRNSYVFPGDPKCLYSLYVRLRGVIEGNSYSGGVPLTTSPVDAGYSAEVASQIGPVRNVRYGTNTPGGVTIDRHFIEITDPHVKYWINANEFRIVIPTQASGPVTATQGSNVYQFASGVGSVLLGVGIGFAIAGVPCGVVQSVNTGANTVTTNIVWRPPTVVGATDIRWTLPAVSNQSAGPLSAVNGSPVFTFTGTVVNGMNNQFLWVDGKPAGNVIAVNIGAKTVTTDMPWQFPSAPLVSTAVWSRPFGNTVNRSITCGAITAVNGSSTYTVVTNIDDRCVGSVLYLSDNTGVMRVGGVVQSVDPVTKTFVTDTPWGYPNVTLSTLYEFTENTASQWNDNRFNSPPHNAYQAVLDSFMLINIRGQASIDTVLDYILTSSPTTAGTVALTNGSTLVTLTGGTFPVATYGPTWLFECLGFVTDIVSSPTTTTLILATPWTGATASGLTYKVVPPIQTTHPYEVSAPVVGAINNRELMPPDDDADHPLIIPWAPRFPLPPDHPRRQFMQVDVLRSSLATTAT